MAKKLFDFCIGNPPYHSDTKNTGDRPNPVYHTFMDSAYEVADVTELITPGRFLFNAGQTSKSWNEKMLNDTHLKVLTYESDATKVFPTTDIKGGVAITLRDSRKEYGPIGTFTEYKELNDIIRKVNAVETTNPRINTIIASQGLYRFSGLFFKKHPEAKSILGKGTGNKIVSKVMKELPDVFKAAPDNEGVYVKFLGRVNNRREYRYILRSYIEHNDYIDTYNLFLPEANNSGHFGETLTLPIVGNPGEGSSDTFLSAGQFTTEIEPANMLKYFKTKFFRALLGAKKVTQHCPPTVWKVIPIQNFKETSDVNWSKDIADIDRQLYRKYRLSTAEIEFIEANVKPME